MRKTKGLISGTVGGRFVVSDQAFESIKDIETSNKHAKYRGEVKRSYEVKKISRPSGSSVKAIRSALIISKP